MKAWTTTQVKLLKQMRADGHTIPTRSRCRLPSAARPAEGKVAYANKGLDIGPQLDM